MWARALIVEGEIVLTPGAKQPLELHASSVKTEGASSPEYPLQKNATVWNICAPLPISTAHQYLQRGVQGALSRQLCHPPFYE
jgi:aspartyl/asparaginyl-tRNA synthetase